MKKYKYIGDQQDGVDVPALGLVGVTKGTHVEVDDPEVAASMEAQTEVWEHVPDAKRSKAAKQAHEQEG